MIVELTEEQRNNILGLIARSPKLAHESSFEFSKTCLSIGEALMRPIPDPRSEKVDSEQVNTEFKLP